MAPTCFGIRPSSRSLQLSLAKVILILKHSVRLCRYLLCGSVAAATPPHNKQLHNLTECYNINITLARLNCKLPDESRRAKHVGAT